jgi:alpha-amylase
LDLKIGAKEISVEPILQSILLTDAYSKRSTLLNGKVSIDSEFDIVLLESKKK